MHFFSLLFPWGLIVQAIALVHFIRRRPDGLWLWIIIFLGPIGALVYIGMEVVPDLGLLRQSFDAYGRRKRIRLLEGVVLENQAAGNFEELADLYMDDGQYARARELYDQVLASPHVSSLDPYYRRGVAALELGDAAAAADDIARVVAKEPKYDFGRAIGLLAHAYAQSGQVEKADASFTRATDVSTLSETCYNYAQFLASQNRKDESQQWLQRILDNKATMPRFARRQEGDRARREARRR